ncbi:hypothetical protein [Anaerocolumna sp. MB42-C2]|uniref:hypothetical protein n=1 Tax=Anaerocolumna sp. MB42-C2 TaxID=3070997 RepID=UPI0027E20FBD|nr:hypothetical protein [Anaerocolumna sp. MB42-C2]WMJ86141.1 hypothetical protein RBU59_19140 [Anaerocolumna sp. MB42-C2]
MFILNKRKRKSQEKEIQNSTAKDETLNQNVESEKVKEEQEYEIVELEILPEKMICPDCGGITLVGLDFCDKCGGELINHDNETRE